MNTNHGHPDKLTRINHDFDVCVVGGGMAGLCAAIASARHGARTALIHDRPVLGGNASSEIRMHICGAHGRNIKETGILEEIQLENCRRNPGLNYSLWDSVLYEKARFCPHLTLFLNASVCDATMDGPAISSVTAWQLTTQTWHTIHAGHFIDCSGDSILAPLSGALTRWGREARRDFDEDIEPSVSDGKTMGNSLLIQMVETDEPQPFVPPRWAYKFRSISDLPNRGVEKGGHNFWWLELGGLADTITDSEAIRHELMCVGYGVFDFMKNHHPQTRDRFANWTLQWMGSLPGKRENRRYIGGHTLTQNDIRAGGKFDDIVAYGGWSMDDHHPAGLLYPGKPTIFHPAPSPYGIPYRSLFSASVPNLLFAGRNISATHAALSSTRVMATCVLLGQAVGTAAAMCVKYRCAPAEIDPSRLAELQATLQEDDVWLPGKIRPRGELSRAAALDTVGSGREILTSGHDRPIGETVRAWTGPLGQPITLSWNAPVYIDGLRLVFDSNLNHDKRMPYIHPKKGNHAPVPPVMTRAFRVETKQADGSWKIAGRWSDNYQRLVRVPVRQHTSAVRLVPEETWGGDTASLFAIDALDQMVDRLPVAPDGPAWVDVVKKVPAKDLAAPESGLEESQGRKIGA